MPAQTFEAPAWGASPFEELDLPSGAHIQVKRLDFMDIAGAGLIDEFDSLSPVVEEKVVGPARGKKPQDRPAKKLTKAQQKKKEEEAGRAFFKDEDGLKRIVKIMARMLPIIVVQPAIVTNLDEDGESIPHDEREDGLVYVDSIPLGDRMAIFSWMMKDLDMESLKSFRDESESNLGDVEDVVSDEVPA
jgi:hypothetical protein